MLKCENMTVQYGKTPIVQDVGFTLEGGQWLMICGPNGAGKSTLVNAIAQGVKYKGNVFLDGQNVRTIKPALLAKRIGVLSQTNTISQAYTVEEVVSLGRYAHAPGVFQKEDPKGREKIALALEATGLTALANRSMLTLSGGEMQRAFLAQVFAQDPAILLLDEPANHLDLIYQQQLFALIEDWLKAPGRAVASVVHDLTLAKRYGTHALLMDDSRVAAFGDIKKALTPCNLQKVYRMDVSEYMQKLLGLWQ